MAVARQSPLVGIFNERAAAETAIEQLHDAGFSDDQISYSANAAHGSFLESIKKFFMGSHAASSTSIANDLADMGLTDDEANYYAREHEAGHTIVAIQPGNRYLEALAILRSNGAYNGYQAGSGSSQMVGTATTAESEATTPMYDRDVLAADQPVYGQEVPPTMDEPAVRAVSMTGDQRTDSDWPAYEQPATTYRQPADEEAAYGQQPAYTQPPADADRQAAYEQPLNASLQSVYDRQSAAYNQQANDVSQADYDRQQAQYNQQIGYAQEPNYNQPAEYAQEQATYNQQAAYARQPADYNQQVNDAQQAADYNQAMPELSAEELRRRKLQEERLVAERVRRNRVSDVDTNTNL